MLQAIVIVPLIAGMTFWLQGVGAALAWVVLNCTYLIFMMPCFFRKYLNGAGIPWIIRDELIPFVIALMICWLSSLMMLPTARSNLSQLCYLTVVWLASLIFTGFALPHARFYFINWFNSFVRTSTM